MLSVANLNFIYLNPVRPIIKLGKARAESRSIILYLQLNFRKEVGRQAQNPPNLSFSLNTALRNLAPTTC